jgi:hypothetical protein
VTGPQTVANSWTLKTVIPDVSLSRDILDHLSYYLERPKRRELSIYAKAVLIISYDVKRHVCCNYRRQYLRIRRIQN